MAYGDALHRSNEWLADFAHAGAEVLEIAALACVFSIELRYFLDVRPRC